MAIVAFMVRQFMGERRQNAEIEREEREAAAREAAAPAESVVVANSEAEATAPAEDTSEMAAAPEAAPAPMPAAEPALAPTQTVITPAKVPARKFRPFRRTAFIWVPFVAGFITQGYFDFGKDYVDLGQAYNDIIAPIVTKYLG
ncbi:MAG: hypothetical protein GC184_08400 [Rhizobiales bacterium]|nr:hypothetical protein [Hyphomicrobiales bacterium]